jgi:hypothetical protein
MTQRRGVKRWIALGTGLGVVAAWGGFGLAQAAPSAPSTITTCTKVKDGKTKVIAPSAVATCTKKGKGIAKTWSTAQLAALNAQVASLTTALNEANTAGNGYLLQLQVLGMQVFNFCFSADADAGIVSEIAGNATASARYQLMHPSCNLGPG